MGWLLLGVLCMGGGTPPPDARRVRLDYGVDASASTCSAESAFRDSVMARLGYQPFADDAPRTVVVRFSREGGVHHATLRVTAPGAPDGQKALTSEATSCDELAAATSLAVSMAIDPLSPMRAREPSPAPPAPTRPEPEPASVDTVTDAPPVEAPAASEGGPGVELLAGPYLGFAQTPALGVGLFVEARLRWARASLGLDVRLELPRDTAWASASLHTQQVSSGLSPCLHLGPAALCGVVVAGVLRAEGRGLAQSAMATTPQLLAGLRAGAQLELSARWSLRLHAEVLARLIQVSLLVGDRAAWVSPNLAGTLGLAAVASF